jgi:hypothetical protein
VLSSHKHHAGRCRSRVLSQTFESDAGMSMIRGQYENRATKHRVTDDVRQHGRPRDSVSRRFLPRRCSRMVSRGADDPICEPSCLIGDYVAACDENGSRACNPFLYT